MADLVADVLQRVDEIENAQRAYVHARRRDEDLMREKFMAAMGGLERYLWKVDAIVTAARRVCDTQLEQHAIRLDDPGPALLALAAALSTYDETPTRTQSLTKATR
jgi:hypothetical protein